MAEDFRRPRLKLARGEEHIVNLHPLLKRLMDSHGCEAVPTVRCTPGTLPGW